MHRPATPLLVLLHGRRPSLLGIQSINLLKNVAVAPLSNTSYCSEQHASTNQQTSTNLIECIRHLNNDWREQVDKEKDYWQKQLDKSQKRLDEEQKLRLEDVRQIIKFETAYLKAEDQRLKVEGRYNIRGAIERTASHAHSLGLITTPHGVQKKLDELASKSSDFQNILTKVVAERKLVQRDVESCIKHLYHELSKYAHGNRDPIVIPTKDFAPGEVAALIAFMRLQDKWTDPLKWEIE